MLNSEHLYGLLLFANLFLAIYIGISYVSGRDDEDKNHRGKREGDPVYAYAYVRQRKDR